MELMNEILVPLLVSNSDLYNSYIEQPAYQFERKVKEAVDFSASTLGSSTYYKNELGVKGLLAHSMIRNPYF